MQLSLKVIGGSNSGKEIKVTVPKFFIGRADDCHLRPQSDAISRHHCVLILEAGSAAVRDFGSRNGTFINGERITEEHKLKNGDQLTVGQLKFEVQITQSIGGQKRPKVKGIADVAARTAQGHRSEEADLEDWLSDDGSGVVKKADLDDDLPELKRNAGATAANSDTTVSANAKTTATNAANNPLPMAQTIFSQLPKTPGKLPFSTEQPIRGKDSRDAAEQMLKRLWAKKT